jgi:hypothetical protein
MLDALYKMGVVRGTDRKCGYGASVNIKNLSEKEEFKIRIVDVRAYDV